ncbi:hypothetical protein DM47_2671 [Burkholderia mallei]|nr:hypothetical protein DM47_2671 [Burkholderia mallei]
MAVDIGRDPVDLLACARRLELRAAPLDQRAAERILEPLERLAHRRLGQVQPRG